MKTSETVSIAKKHAIRTDTACPDFFEGAVLGNGDLGCILCSRPDGIVFYFGHNNIWDIRVDESHKDTVGTFDPLWKRILDEKDTFQGADWYQEYYHKMRHAYTQIYPRPYPASALYLFFDRKEYEVTGQELDISTGLVSVYMEDLSGKKYTVQAFVAQHADTVYCRTVDENSEPAAIFSRMRLVPHTPDQGLPEYTVLDNGFSQLLPANGYSGTVRPGYDRGFTVQYRINGCADSTGLSANLTGTTEIVTYIREGFADEVLHLSDIRDMVYSDAFAAAVSSWRGYWECSGIRLEDDFLEHIWYTNTYFIRCALNENCRCPGLFANWMYGNIGTAWHGDYHMNYNTQQPFWGLMAANRQQLHMPYLRLAEELLPISKSWANDFYKLNGACFPHSAYPVPMTVNPYPVPDWGWEIFETPWTVQSLWWHYTYTQDKELLRIRIYPLMREAAAFLADYMMRRDSGCKDDGKFHIFPSVVPELYGLANGLEKNQDSLADLAFTKFLFRAVLCAIEILGLEDEESALADSIKCILSAYPDYPTAISKRGEVYTSIEREDPDHVIYNVPANLLQIFPCEDIDARRGTEHEKELAARSYLYHYNEGGNDLVLYHMVGARLGMLDLEKFKRQIRYSLIPNGTASDRATLSGGRYPDGMDLSFMCRMGIWFENFSVYAVIDECLLWGHSDIIELFPNWDKSKRAEFCSLRTKGAFLVSASCADGEVLSVTVVSEQGGEMKLKNPWKHALDQNGTGYADEVICVCMEPGECLTFCGADAP